MSDTQAVLYVEDEETDALLLGIAYKRAELLNPLRIALDGVEAIDYLAGKGPYADRRAYPLPCLLLLDLKLPRKSGFEVLEWIRQQPAFADLPVVIYTSSDNAADRQRAKSLRAYDYVLKSGDLRAVAAWLRSLAPLCYDAPAGH